MHNLDTAGLNEIFDILETGSNSSQLSESNHTPQSNDVEINVSHIYSQLSELVNAGKKTLTSAQLVLDQTGDPESIAGVASVIDSLRQVMAEYNKVNLVQIKHTQQMELENTKFEHRKELTSMRLNSSDEISSTDMVPFNTETFVDAIIDSKS